MVRGLKFEWVPTVLAAVAFVGFLVAFGWELFAYQHKVVEWAQRDLQSRADLAAANLEEPLRTQDFRKIHAFGDKVAADGYRLSVFDANGRGRVFDTLQKSGTDALQFHADQKCGEYLIRLWIPKAEVLKSFRRALIGVALAGLVGIAGVLLFFFVTYRQRVHIRELKRLETFRREFIADVSHEIKTPLTGILGAIDMMTGDEVKVEGQGQQWRVLLDLIKGSAKRLNGLVQSILDLARLEREGEVLNRTETDLVGLVREAVAEKLAEAEAKGISLSCRLPERDIRLAVDAQLISQAVSNLIANALRHSGSRDVAVSLSSEARETTVSVEDHGVGVPPEEAERIFERFHRVDPARAAETGGAGLGLAIVRRIARLHGGDVTLSAAKPHGAVFTMSLPVADSAVSFCAWRSDSSRIRR